MGSSFNLTIPRPERSLADALSEVPRAFKVQAQAGFKVLASVGKQHYAEILKAVIETLESRKASLEDLEKHLGLGQSDLSSLMAASMLTMPMMGRADTADEFLAAAVKVDLISSDLTAGLRPFIEAMVTERASIQRAIRQAALPAQALPFLSEVEIVVDLRIAFNAEAVVDAVPVALLHLDTNAEGAEIWFQASKPQMERLKREIEEAIRQMEAAQVWSRREPVS